MCGRSALVLETRLVPLYTTLHLRGTAHCQQGKQHSRA